MNGTVAQPLRLGLVEARILFRRKITVFSAAVLPLGLCLLTWFNRDIPAQRWGNLIGMRVVLLLLVSIFLTSATVYTARRQALVLKRLRTSDLTDTGVIGGITAPIVLLGLVQMLVYLGFCVAIGAPVPQRPLLVLLGVVLGVALTVAAGMATAALSKSVEATQITAFPVLIAAMAGSFMRASGQPAVAAAGVGMPLVGPANLISKGWSGTDAGASWSALPTPLLGLASTLLWTVVFGLIIRTSFHWEPRR